MRIIILVVCVVIVESIKMSWKGIIKEDFDWGDDITDEVMEVLNSNILGYPSPEKLANPEPYTKEDVKVLITELKKLL
jgi:hypothetical protein